MARAVADRAGGALAAGAETLKGSVGELTAAGPDLERVGYRLGDVELVVTIVPRLVVYLTRVAAVGDEAFQAVLADHPNERTFRTLVGLLRQANRILGRVELRGRRCTGLTVELGVPPAIRLVYAATEPGPAAPPADARPGAEPPAAGGKV
ncbi:MAG: hypothetical protein ACJ786_07380 [Catenulispora sp.]